MSAASLDDLRTGRTPGPAAYRDEDFPGRESFHLPAGRLEHYEYRLEFRDGYTETVSRGAVEPGVSRVEVGGDPPGADRGSDARRLQDYGALYIVPPPRME